MKLHNASYAAILAILTMLPLPATPATDLLEKQFRELPMDARRLTGPLFWLHGDESKERLEMYLERVAESGNGSFTAESRPHRDWLGKGWYRDLDICLQAAKKLDLKMWIFDEKWWPSQGIAGKVDPRYAAKRLVGEAVDTEGGRLFEAEGYSGERYIAALAGKLDADGKVEGNSIVDLKGSIKNGKLSWQVPAGKWKIMKFTYVLAPGLGQGGGRQLSVDGASRDCTEWFIQTVYQPHYDHFKKDFGKTIPGFFYDEPETRGDWGTDLNATLKDWNVDWKKAYVAYKFELAGEEQTAARYQYLDAFAETWGRIMYGLTSEWCRKRNVVSMGHFMEHGYLYVHREFCAGDMMRLQKYSDMGGIDLVCRQMYPGKRPHNIYQTPKLGSSITHVFNKPDDITMCEMFGAYGQDITYPQMKWLTDQMQVRGVNFMIPHSFNPRAPYDHDCPPYFYDGGFEPRYPLYRVYADYTSRLALMLTGGRHVCPVALLFGGNTRHVGKSVTPEDMTSVIQDSLYDCDWLPFEVFENNAKLAGKDIKLHSERYQVLVVPPAEVIPYATLEKAKIFFENGGIVIGYGFLPSKSATIGKTAKDIAALCFDIWGNSATPGTASCKRNGNGGRSFFLAEKPTVEDLSLVLEREAGIPPLLKLVEGDTGNWLHVLHRVKDGSDVFLVCNQNHEGTARRFKFRAIADGTPEAWDAMRNEINALPHKRTEKGVEFDLVLEPLDSVLVVFHPKKRELPARLETNARPASEPIVVTRDTTVVEAEPQLPQAQKPDAKSPLEGCSWVWYPEGNPAASAPPGTRYFRGKVTVPADRKIKAAKFVLSCDNQFTLVVNGKEAGSNPGGDSWSTPEILDITKALQAGENQLAIRAVNESDQPNPAGLIGSYVIDFESGPAISGRVDGSWKAGNTEQACWEKAGFDDKAWVQAKEVVPYGGQPWGKAGLEERRKALTLSPVKADIFNGKCEIPASVDLAKSRVCLELTDLVPEAAANISVNGKYAGGFIGKPFRLDVTKHLKTGTNTIRIAPFAPKTAQLVIHK